MGYGKILVVLDCFELAKEVLQQAIVLGQKEFFQLMVFYCILVDSQDLSIYFSFYGEVVIGFFQIIKEYLEE